METTTDPAGPVHRFEPQRPAAKREAAGAAVFAFVVVLATLYGYGERDWPMMLVFAAGGTALVLAGGAARMRTAWTDAIELSPQGITLVRGGRPRTLAWTAVKSIRHGDYGGEHWLLVPHGGRDPLVVSADGLTRAEVRVLRELIPALHATARGERDPGPATGVDARDGG
ncbi:MAG TPA: hypothetical protein VHG08_00930 [Longimicrobium sp.]|nr:hypothetical protein [Longimicrobium sp.]